MVVERRIKRMPWKETGQDMNRHDEFCHRLDEILIDTDAIDDGIYWCIMDRFHAYMGHANHANERSLVSYIQSIAQDEDSEDLAFDLLDLYDEMRGHIDGLLPDPRHPHDYTHSVETIFTLLLETPGSCFYTTISRN